MIVRTFSLVVALILAGLAAIPSHAAERPNILILFSDDQRADTIHSLGNGEIATPHLDRLVNRGVAFSEAHIMGGTQPAVCVPSRAMLMSGRSLFRVSMNLERETLMPAHFATHGYDTFGTGKWHNGGASFARAFQSGDRIFLGGMSDQFKVPWRDFASLKNPQAKPTLGEQFSTEMFVDSAIEFVKQKRERPFLCYVAFTAPHDPRQSPGKFATMYDPAKLNLPANYAPVHPFNNGELLVRDEKLAAWPRTPEIVRRELADYYGIISHLDEQIGRLLGTLEASGQLKNTIVVFAADNGLAIGSHGLLGKQNLYEHSVRVPLVIAGPGIPEKRRSRAMLYSFDLLPTLCELAGVTAPSEIDGRSFVPALRDDQAEHRTSLFAAYRNVQRSVRDRQFKLIRYPQINKSQLFDLQADPAEQTDLVYVPDHAERVGEMTRQLEQAQREWGDESSLYSDQPQPYRISLQEKAANAR